MENKSFHSLKELLAERDIDIAGPAAPELISKAEVFLGMEFPEDYKVFLREWGTLGVGPLEFYGITGPEFNNSSVPNGIWYTAKLRENAGLPKNLIVLWDDNGDQYFCLDAISSIVVVWDVVTKQVSRMVGNLFDFIMQEVLEYP